MIKRVIGVILVLAPFVALGVLYWQNGELLKYLLGLGTMVVLGGIMAAGIYLVMGGQND